MIVHLEKFDPHGYDLLLSWVDSAESLMQFAGPTFTYPLTREQLDKSLSDENRLPFKLVGTGSEKMIGYAEIYLTPESAYLGRIIIGDPLDRGKRFRKTTGNTFGYLCLYRFSAGKSAA